MSETNSINRWTEHLCNLAPPTGVTVIGAGSGESEYIQQLKKLNLSDVTLFEADENRFKQLKGNTKTLNKWLVKNRVISEKLATTTFYSATLPRESGLVSPECLRPIWPNIRTASKHACEGIPIDHITEKQAKKPNWLVVDCLPALPILDGGSALLHHVDIVITRYLDDSTAPTLKGVHLWEIDSYLSKLSFERINTELESNRSIGHAVYLRNIKSQNKILKKDSKILQRSLNEKQQEVTQLKADSESYKELIEQKIVRLKQQEIDITKKTKMISSIEREKQTIQERLSEAQARIQNLELKLRENKDDQCRDFKKNLNDNFVSLERKIRDLRNDLSLEITTTAGNSTKQLEAFMSIQNFLNFGDLASSFHGWPISPDIGFYLLNRIRNKKYDHIIEFGSGTSTLIFAKTKKLLKNQKNDGQKLKISIVSFEHKDEYFNATKNILQKSQADEYVDLLLSPLKETTLNQSEFLYYDCEKKLAAIAKETNKSESKILVLIDGPPADTCTNTRYPAIPLITKYFRNCNLDIVLDDYKRNEEQQIVEEWRSFLRKSSTPFTEHVIDCEKGAILLKIKTRE